MKQVKINKWIGFVAVLMIFEISFASTPPSSYDDDVISPDNYKENSNRSIISSRQTPSGPHSSSQPRQPLNTLPNRWEDDRRVYIPQTEAKKQLLNEIKRLVTIRHSQAVEICTLQLDQLKFARNEVSCRKELYVVGDLYLETLNKLDELMMKKENEINLLLDAETEFSEEVERIIKGVIEEEESNQDKEVEKVLKNQESLCLKIQESLDRYEVKMIKNVSGLEDFLLYENRERLQREGFLEIWNQYSVRDLEIIQASLARAEPQNSECSSKIFLSPSPKK